MATATDRPVEATENRSKINLLIRPYPLPTSPQQHTFDVI
jgi:hypothetical protein